MAPKSTKEILLNLAAECLVRRDALAQERRDNMLPTQTKEFECYRIREGNLLDLGVVFTRAADKMEE